MQATILTQQLAAHLERELQPIYTVYGDEPLLVIEAGDAIRAAAEGMENLLAQEYEINAGFPMPKATVTAGVRMNF